MEGGGWRVKVGGWQSRVPAAGSRGLVQGVKGLVTCRFEGLATCCLEGLVTCCLAAGHLTESEACASVEGSGPQNGSKSDLTAPRTTLG